mmetsp:Transcript_12702/g.21549  ORF Transcript_12702/g.21549 Transcript_12702/m.21549 type:complete len:102 (-) Transcript_12702:214-519(-)
MSRIFEIAQRTNCCYSNTTTMSHGLSQDEIDDLKEAFNMFDVDGGGSISKEELKGVMKKLGSDPTDDEIQAMINSVDDNGDGEIDFDEFLEMIFVHWQLYK